MGRAVYMAWDRDGTRTTDECLDGLFVDFGSEGTIDSAGACVMPVDGIQLYIFDASIPRRRHNGHCECCKVMNGGVGLPMNRD